MSSQANHDVDGNILPPIPPSNTSPPTFEEPSPILSNTNTVSTFNTLVSSLSNAGAGSNEALSDASSQ